MDTKEELITHIRSWIDIDNEISKLQKQIKDFRNEKKELTGSLVDIMKTNEMTHE